MPSDALVDELVSAGVANTWLVIRDADRILPILAAHCGADAKAKALRVLLEVSVGELDWGNLNCLAGRLRDALDAPDDPESESAARRVCLEILAPEAPDA